MKVVRQLNHQAAYISEPLYMYSSHVQDRYFYICRDTYTFVFFVEKNGP